MRQKHEGGRINMSERFDMAYFDSLLKSSKASKKQVAVYLDDATIETIYGTSRENLMMGGSIDEKADTAHCA